MPRHGRTICWSLVCIKAIRSSTYGLGMYRSEGAVKVREERVGELIGRYHDCGRDVTITLE